MWTLLFAAVTLLVVFLYVPGYLFLRSISLLQSRAVIYAPFVTITAYSFLAILYQKVGVFSSWATITLPVFGGVIFCFLVIQLRKSPFLPYADKTLCTQPSLDSIFTYLQHKKVFSFLVFLLTGIVGTTLLFILPLGAADAFICGFDIAHHLSAARAFVESGNWSTLTVSLYPDELGGFYPSVNSLLAALVMSALNTPATLALNSVNIVIVGVVMPLGMWLFLGKVFDFSDARLYFGAFCCVAFLALPWELLTRSAPLLYAFVVGMALLPSFMALLTDIFPLNINYSTKSMYLCHASNRQREVRPIAIMLIGIALIAIALSHPSAFFSGMLFAIYYIAHFIVTTRATKQNRWIAYLIRWLLVCACVWILLYKAPFMQSVVSYSYNAKCGLLSGVARILLLWAPHVGAQYILGLIVGIGLLACLFDKQRKWLLGPWGLTAIICLVCLTVPPGPFRFFVSGFWYNHATRLMATLALFAMPLAAQGFGAIVQFITCAISKTQGEKMVAAQHLATLKEALSGHICPNKAGLVVVILLMVLIAFLPLPLPRAATLHGYAQQMHNFNDPAYRTSFLREEEREFLETVSRTIGNKNLILNAPHDGSAFAYPLYGLNTMARSFHPYANDDSLLLAHSIHCIASDAYVSQAAKTLGVEYVLQLDALSSNKPTVYKAEYNPEDWEGIFAIEEDTPGFELVLKEGDMRLYRIILDE